MDWPRGMTDEGMQEFCKKWAQEGGIVEKSKTKTLDVDEWVPYWTFTEGGVIYANYLKVSNRWIHYF